MRDEEWRFAQESALRAQISRMCAKLEKQRTAPRLTLAENVARISEAMAWDRRKEMTAAWAYPRKQGRIYKINQAWPNVWSYSS
jgi:hypothetical protein